MKSDLAQSIHISNHTLLLHCRMGTDKNSHQLDCRDRSSKRDVHGATGRPFQEKWPGCGTNPYPIKFSRHSGDLGRRDWVFFMDGANEVQANLKGANLALVAGATNRQVFSLMAKADIKQS